MRRLLLPLLLVLLARGQAASFDEDEVFNGVTTLHANSLLPFIAKHKYAGVLFIDGLMEKSQAALREIYLLTPDFALDEHSLLHLGYIDCNKFRENCKDLHVQHSPFFVVYVDGRGFEYRGRSFQSRDLQEFADKITRRNATLVDSDSDLERILNSKRAFVFYFREEVSAEELQGQLDIVNAVAANHHKLSFYYTPWHNTTKGHGEVDPFSRFNFIVHRRFGDGNGTLASNGTLPAADLELFLTHSKRPDISKMNNKFLSEVFKKHQPAAILFFSDPNDQSVKDFHQVAKEFKGKLLFSMVDSAHQHHDPIRNFLGVTSRQKHLVKIMDTHDNFPRRFRLSKWNLDKLRQFVSHYLEGKLTPFYKSARPPTLEEQAESVIKKVVGKTFQSMVLDSPENILLVGHLGSSESDIEEYVEFLENYLEKLDHVVGTRFVPMIFDARVNEHPAFRHRAYPITVLYKAGEKDHPKTLHGRLTFGNLVRFLERHLGRMRYEGPDKSIPIDGSL